MRSTMSPDTQLGIEPARQHYLLIKLAQQQFGVNPDQLSASEVQQVTSSASALGEMQTLIGQSGEAALVHIAGCEVEQALAQLIEQCGDEAQFQLLLNKHHLTRESLSACLREELLCEQVLKRVASQVPPLPNAKAYDYYQQHLAKFSRSRMWQVSHLLITINDAFSDNTRPAARARIDALYQQANADNFGQLALQHSECPSALDGGALGWCEAGKLFAEIESALQWLPVNVVSAPIETEAGFHLVLCHEQKPERVASFEQALPAIEKLHAERAARYLQKQWLAALRAKK